MSDVKLYHGPMDYILAMLPEDSLDSCVTDPPYGIKFMARKWDYDVPSVDDWKAVYRVLKPGAYLLAFASPRTQHRMAANIEDAGFEIRDMIAWLYGSGMPKSVNVEKLFKDDPELAAEYAGYGTGLKPGFEPITLARKPFKGTIAANIRKHGTSAMNIDGCRVPKEDGDRTAYSVDGDEGSPTASVYGERERVAYNPHADGRWPATIIHDGSDEVKEVFPDGSHRFFYCAKASQKDRNEGCDNLTLKPPGEMTGGRKEGSAGLSNGRAGAGRTSGAKNFWPTVKPVALMQYLVRLVTPEGGTTLDPYHGSGSTSKGAIREAFDIIAVDRDSDAVTISEARISHELGRPFHREVVKPHDWDDDLDGDWDQEL